MPKWYPGKYAIKGAKKVTKSVVKLPGKVVSSVKKVAAEHKKKSFRKHFAKARKNKKKVFIWKGKEYNTKIYKPKPKLSPAQQRPTAKKPKAAYGKIRNRPIPAGPSKKPQLPQAPPKKKVIKKKPWYSGKKGRQI